MNTIVIGILLAVKRLMMKLSKSHMDRLTCGAQVVNPPFTVFAKNILAIPANIHEKPAHVTLKVALLSICGMWLLTHPTCCTYTYQEPEAKP